MSVIDSFFYIYRMIAYTYYHIYNRANGSENLFRNEENYHYFLSLWTKYIEPIAGTYAYCLMPNHFHFLIQTNQIEFKKSESYSKTFSNLFNAYAKAYNKRFSRRGSLFMRPFKYKEISSDDCLINIVNYIHRNPVHHGFKNRPEDWPYSSYETFFTSKPTKLRREEVLSWFDGVVGFKEMHQWEKGLSDASILID